MRDLWPVSDWVDLNVPADARVALLGEPRGYYMNREVLWADGYEQEKIRYSEIGGPQGLVDALEEAGVSYVVARLGSPLGLVAGYGRLQPRTPANWEDIDYSRKDSRWLALYEVAVKRGLLQQVYPDPGAASSDLGGYAVYHVGRT
jgi:hypothetical protein